MTTRDCLDCGFVCDEGDDRCPKCDAVLAEQTDGTVATVDVAHRGETVVRATAKLERAVARALAGRARALRVITGRAAVRDAILPLLASMAAAGRIASWRADGANDGAFLLTLRRGRGRT